MNTKYYKVLKNGRSCDGGRYAWSLPTRLADGTWVPGDWAEMPSIDPLILCRSGFHVTSDPVSGGWYASDRQVYVAEIGGETVGPEPGGDKIAARCVRLTRELTDTDLAEIRVFTSGSHKIQNGAYLAYGSASVKASGSASVEAYGSASVEAYDSASIEAYDSASIEAYGSASVEAYGSASVRAKHNATVSVWSGNPKVHLQEYALRIDRRATPPRVYRAKRKDGAT